MSDATAVTLADEAALRRAIEVAREARDGGNHPFGAVLVTADGSRFEAENSAVTEDVTCHAETNLVRLVSTRLSAEQLLASTLYASTEPCAMCAGAIYWAGIGRVVYALPEQALAALIPADDGESTMDLPCREVFARGGRAVVVAGPALEQEAATVHAGFW